MTDNARNADALVVHISGVLAHGGWLRQTRHHGGNPCRHRHRYFAGDDGARHGQLNGPVSSSRSKLRFRMLLAALNCNPHPREVRKLRCAGLSKIRDQLPPQHRSHLGPPHPCRHPKKHQTCLLYYAALPKTHVKARRQTIERLHQFWF